MPSSTASGESTGLDPSPHRLSSTVTGRHPSNLDVDSLAAEQRKGSVASSPKSLLVAEGPSGATGCSTAANTESSNKAQPLVPPLAKFTKRFMNPFAEREAIAERGVRAQQRHRVQVQHQPVPTRLSPSQRDEALAMGLMLHHRMNRSSHASHVVLPSHRAFEILDEIDLRWTAKSASVASSPQPCLSNDENSTSPAGRRQTQPRAQTPDSLSGGSTDHTRSPTAHGRLPPPLPVVVRRKIRLSNDDARVLFRSGATRSGQFGVFRWAYEEEDVEGREKPYVPYQDEILDPLDDFILAEEAQEARDEDGGLMIPFDLKHLLEDTPPEADDLGNGYNDRGESCYYGKRHLLAFNLLRLWQHHYRKSGITAESTGTTGGGGGPEHSQRSLSILIDSPRSAFILVKNGQKASDLVLSTDPLTEERRQRQIRVLQDQYRDLCKLVSQQGMVQLLQEGAHALSSTVSSPPSITTVGGRGTTPDGRSLECPQRKETSLVAASPGQGLRLASRGSTSSSVLQRSELLAQAEARAKHAAESKAAEMVRRVELHREELAGLWGRELNAFTRERTKELHVKAVTTAVRQEKKLRAIGLARTTTPPDISRSATVTAASPSPAPNDGSSSVGDASGAQPVATRATNGSAAQKTEPSTPAKRGKVAPGGTSNALPTIASGGPNSPAPRATPTKAPLEIVREQYQAKEAERIRQLEAAIAAKDAAARRCQERKRKQLEQTRKEQLAQLQDVRETCERVKRANDFQTTLMLLTQNQEELSIDALRSELHRRRVALQEVSHAATLKERSTHDVLQRAQTTLLKTLYYEAQRRTAEESLQRARGKDERESLARAGAQHLAVLSSPSPKGDPELTAGSSPPRRRTQWDSVVEEHSKAKLTALLAQEAEVQEEWKQLPILATHLL